MGFKLPAAHKLTAYRCSLPGLAGFTGLVAQGSNPTRRAGMVPVHAESISQGKAEGKNGASSQIVRWNSLAFGNREALGLNRLASMAGRAIPSPPREQSPQGTPPHPWSLLAKLGGAPNPLIGERRLETQWPFLLSFRLFHLLPSRDWGPSCSFAALTGPPPRRRSCP